MAAATGKNRYFRLTLMSKKKAAVEAHGPTKAAKPENTPKKHALTPEMEARKWKPGESGNPGGRPKKDLSAQMAEEIFEENYEAIKRALARKLRKGDIKAFEGAASRKWGKAAQPVDVSGGFNVIIDI